MISMRRVAAGRWTTEQCVWFNRDNENHGLWKIRGRKMEEPWLLCAALTAMSSRGKLRCRRESRQERRTGSPKHHPKRWMSGWQWPLLRGGPRGIGEKTTPDFLNRWKTEEIAQHHWFSHDPLFPFFHSRSREGQMTVMAAQRGTPSAAQHNLQSAGTCLHGGDAGEFCQTRR